jgi:Ala-tRNA(Pro) deacylase
MLTVIDNNLGAQPEIYFEAGDHEELIHMKQEEFTVLMHDAVDAGFAARR